MLISCLEKPNQAMQRTASQPAIYVVRLCHPPLRSVARFSGLAVADLVSRSTDKAGDGGGHRYA